MTRKEKETSEHTIAMHEASHAVIGLVLGHNPDFVTIERGKIPKPSIELIYLPNHSHEAGGWCGFSNEPSIECILAGIAAEVKLGKKKNLIQNAEKNRTMQLDFFVALGRLRNISPNLSKDEIQLKLISRVNETKKLVDQYWTEINQVATILQRKKTLTGEEVKKIVGMRNVN